MKHIEQILPEYAADDMTALLLSDATASESLSRLLHDWTGCDIPYPNGSDGEPLHPQSEVEELVPLCLSILRRHWTTPLTALGDGTTPMSLADLLRRLIGDRVQGNEAWSIPPFTANIPTAVSQLLARKISGVPEAPDGISLVQLLTSTEANDSVTELVDDNRGWVMSKPLTTFPNAEKILLGCSEIVRKYNTNDALYSFSKCKSLRAPWLKKISSTTDSGLPSYTPIFNGSPLEEVDLSELQSYTGRLFVGGSLPEELNLPKLTNAGTCIAQGCAGVKRIIAENVTICKGYSYHPNLINGCPDLEYAYIPNLSAYTVYGDNDGASSLQDMPKLSHLVIGKAPFTNTSKYVRFALDGCPNLVLLDIRGGLSQNIYLDHWNPTTALSERLPEFLSNFKTYIAQRLTDNGSGLTLTLSQAVRDAIQTDPEIVSIITSKGWTISPAPSV